MTKDEKFKLQIRLAIGVILLTSGLATYWFTAPSQASIKAGSVEADVTLSVILCVLGAAMLTGDFIVSLFKKGGKK